MENNDVMFEELLRTILGSKKKEDPLPKEIKAQIEANAETRLPFGTHAGERLRDVPRDYLNEKGRGWTNKHWRGAAEVELLRRAQEVAGG